MTSGGVSQENKPKRVVVIGANGFIGARLKSLLQSLKIDCYPVTSKSIDLTNPSSVPALKEIIQPGDQVVITSALTPDKGKDVSTFMLNVTMGQHLHAAFKEIKCQQVIYISSDAVYADRIHLIRENSNCNPSSYHGLMHLVREKMLSEATKSSATPFLILRPCAIYGKGDTHQGYGPNKFIVTATESGKIALFGKGEEKRDHIFIDDVINLINLALHRRISGVLNLASGHSVAFAEVAGFVQNSLNKQVEIQCSERKSEIIHSHFDISELLAVFPEFSFTDIANGIERSIKQ